MVDLHNNLPDTKQLKAELDEVYNEFSLKLDELKLRARSILDVVDKRINEKETQIILDKIKNIK